ncbi:hypothetical protein JTB14_002048 [Gonioctena quinquepunctata]|nr:hypothetical protein JTB14_002048 [Gonioctena quinquepunctata]
MSGILKTFNFLNTRLLPKSCIFSKMGFLNFQPSVMTIKSEARERLKQLKIPEKPKKPLTPYIQFVKEKQSIIAKENPNIKQSEVLKKCADEWKNVSDISKEKYSQKFKAESEIYNDEILRYNSNLSEEQLSALKLADAEKRKSKAKRKINKLNKENKKPKKPMGPYLLYLKEQSEARNIPPRDVMKIMKGEWEKLPEPEKQRYKNHFLKEKAKYEAVMMEWEKKMIEEGHGELVRVKSLSDERPSRIRKLKEEADIENSTQSTPKGKPPQ